MFNPPVYFPFQHYQSSFLPIHCYEFFCCTTIHRHYDMEPLRNAKYRFDFQNGMSRNYLCCYQPREAREQYDRELTRDDKKIIYALRKVLDKAEKTEFTYCLCCHYTDVDQPEAIRKYQQTTYRHIRTEEFGNKVLAFEFDIDGDKRVDINDSSSKDPPVMVRDSIVYDIQNDILWSGSILSDDEIHRVKHMRDILQTTQIYEHRYPDEINNKLCFQYVPWMCCCVLPMYYMSYRRDPAITEAEQLLTEDKYAQLVYQGCCMLSYYHTFSRDYRRNEWVPPSSTETKPKHEKGSKKKNAVAPEKEVEICH